MDLVRWALVPFAALCGCATSFLIAIPVSNLIHFVLWSCGHYMPGKMFLIYVLPFDGAVAASLFILFGTWTAPSHKKAVTAILFVIGAVIAWFFVGETHSPQHIFSHRPVRSPIRIWWPIIGTYTGGICTLILVCLFLGNRQTDHGPKI